MLAAGRRWLRRHRTSIAVGLGVVGAGYLAAQFVVSKITEAKDRMLGDRAAREKYSYIQFSLFFFFGLAY